MIAVDTSVVVAGLLSWHEKHATAARALEKALASSDALVIPVHVLLESFAVLTRLPPPHRMSPTDALALLRDNFSEVRLASLGVRSTWPLLSRLAEAKLAGGITYDAAILEAAQDAGAKTLLTLNARDYDRLDPTLAIEFL